MDETWHAYDEYSDYWYQDDPYDYYGLSQPTPYSPQPTDNMDRNNIQEGMHPQMLNACVTSIMELINHIFGGNINEGAFILYYLQAFNINVHIDGVNLAHISTLVNQFFHTTNFTNYQQAIDNGHIVITDIASNEPISSHNVAIVGYQNDGDLIYMDPARGYLQVASPTTFVSNYVIVITGNK